MTKSTKAKPGKSAAKPAVKAKGPAAKAKAPAAKAKSAKVAAKSAPAKSPAKKPVAKKAASVAKPNAASKSSSAVKKAPAKPAKKAAAVKPVAKPAAKTAPTKPVAKPVVAKPAKAASVKPVAKPPVKAAPPAKPVAAKPVPKPAEPVIIPRKKVTTTNVTILPPDYDPKKDKGEFMNPVMLEYFRQKLIQWREELLRESTETIQVTLQGTELQKPDLADRASAETDHALELRTRDRERKLISKINEALLRIEDGTYGYCEETGEPITVGRLDARPIATLSLEAQERHERLEKTHRDE